MNLLLDSFNGKEWLDYNHLYIYGKSLHQSEYQILNQCFKYNNSKKDIIKCIKHKNEPVRNKQNSSLFIELFDDDGQIPNPSEFDSNHKNLIVFDDIMLENQDKIEHFYTRG